MTDFTQGLLAHVGLKHLRLAIAVADRLSILKAAGDLNMSQPTATKLLKDLELELGFPLFERHNRGVAPNELGRAFVVHARAVLARFEHAIEDVADLASGGRGRVAVGTLLAASAELLPLAISGLHRESPKIMVRVVEGANNVLMPKLVQGDLDLVVGRLSEYRYRKDIEQIPLLAGVGACVVARGAHPLAGRRNLSLRALASAQWILPPPETTLRRQVDAAFRDAGLEPPSVAIESVSMLTNRALLERSDLLSVWPRPVLEREARRNSVIALAVEIPSASSSIGVSVRRDAQLSPAAQALLLQLRAAADRIARAGG